MTAPRTHDDVHRNEGRRQHRAERAELQPDERASAARASLQIVTSDLGATGTGGTLTDNDTVAIDVEHRSRHLHGQQGIGGPGTAGSSYALPRTYTVAGGGSDIGHDEDQFQYLYMTMTGDGRLTAKVG